MADPSPEARTFSYRAVVIGLASMVAPAIWVHFREVLVGGRLVHNSPPAQVRST